MSTFWCRNYRHGSPHLLCGAEDVIDRQAILTVELNMWLVFLKMSSRFSIETNTILYFFLKSRVLCNSSWSHISLCSRRWPWNTTLLPMLGSQACTAHHLQFTVYMVLGILPRAFCLLGNQSINCYILSSLVAFCMSSCFLRGSCATKPSSRCVDIIWRKNWDLLTCLKRML